MNDNSIYLDIPIRTVYDDCALREMICPILKDVKIQGGQLAEGICESMIHEALNNAADHGVLGMEEKDKDLRARMLEDPKIASKKVSLYYLRLGDLSFSINVDDYGRGFNHDKIMREIRERDEKPPKTYVGLRMMTKMSDVFYFNERGNSVTMMKFFDKI